MNLSPFVIPKYRWRSDLEPGYADGCVVVRTIRLPRKSVNPLMFACCGVTPPHCWKWEMLQKPETIKTNRDLGGFVPIFVLKNA